PAWTFAFIDEIYILTGLVAVFFLKTTTYSSLWAWVKAVHQPKKRGTSLSIMADHAPGMGPATKEPSCINCGGVGHWAVACPEPVRAKPAGNPIVTRYAPPPGQPHAPPYPGPLPSYPSYPPPPNGYPPPPAGSYPGYSQFSPPPPPPPGAYPPPPAPPAPYHYPAAGQYGGPPLPGPSSLPPPPYQPPQYAAGAPYPPPSYQSAPGYQPGPPPSSVQYPPSYNSTPPGGYPQPPYGSQQPPPPNSYPPSYGPPAPGYGHPPPLPGPPRATPPGLPPIPPPRSQPPRDRNGRHRQGHNNRDRSRRNKNGNQPKRDASQSRPKSGNKDRPEAQQPEAQAKATEAPSVASGTPESRNVNIASEQEADEEFDWKWEEEMVFKELGETHQPDPIAMPLPGPENYHDNVMLPPAWNATWIQSRFAKEGNLEDFSRPIRETEFFITMQYDPAFWKCPEGRAHKQLPEPREKTSTFKSSRLPGFPSLPPKPPTPENRDYRLINNRKRTLDDSAYKNPRARGGQEVGEWADHRHKRHKVESLSGYNANSPHNRRSRDDLRPVDRNRHQRPEHTDSDPAQALLVSLDESQDTGSSRRFDEERVAGLQDSGYYSSRHVRRQTSTNSFQERGASPPLTLRGTSRPESRPQSRQASQSRSRSRHSRRRGSHSSPAESRPVSRQSAASFGTEASELSALEAELLGIAPKSKGDRDGKHDGMKMRKRVTKVDSAYR
ncbi:hypothetical protein CORC01_04171, partial [Colletotrichum orchidophilum]